MKLNASKTKTMIVSSSLTMHPQSHPLTIGGTVLKESDDLVILRVTFDSKMTFEKHLRSVSRVASQRLGVLRKSWLAFHDRSLLGRCFRGFVLPVYTEYTVLPRIDYEQCHPQNTPPVRNRTSLTARSSSLRCVSSAEHNTAEQYSKTDRKKT